MLKIPLTTETKDELKHLRASLLHVLGDNFYQRHPDRYDADHIEVPEPLASSDKILSQAPKARGSDSIGSILTFRNDGPFMMLFFYYHPREGASYRLGSHAGWHKRGTEEHALEHYRALDSLLEQFGALEDRYEFSCPCGDTEIVKGGYTAVVDYLEEHVKEAHSDGRTPINVLTGRKVTAADSEPAATNASAKAATQ